MTDVGQAGNVQTQTQEYSSLFICARWTPSHGIRCRKSRPVSMHHVINVYRRSILIISWVLQVQQYNVTSDPCSAVLYILLFTGVLMATELYTGKPMHLSECFNQGHKCDLTHVVSVIVSLFKNTGEFPA